MGTINSFEELECWKAARELARAVYRITRKPSFSKDFELKNQMRAAAVSAVSNIAEGFEREGRPERLRFLGIGKASSGEVRAQLYVALDEGYIVNNEFLEVKNLAERTSQLTKGFARYLQSVDINKARLEAITPRLQIKKRVTHNV